MRMSKILGMLSAVTLAATPIVANAADASRLSLAGSAAAVQSDADGGPDRSFIALGVLGAIAIATGVAIVITNNDDDEEAPTSP